MRSSTLQQRRKQGDKRSIAAAAWEGTAVSQLFEGQMSFMTLCMHCDHQAHSSQTFTVLSLPIPTDTSKCTIEVTVYSCRHTGTVSAPTAHNIISDDIPLSLLCLCCAGLSVTVLPTDYPYWGGADAVLSVWTEERNHSLHVSG